MYPYEKANLIAYRSIARLIAVALAAYAVLAVLFRKPSGMVFLVTCGIAAVVHFWNAFRWHPEPTARRQFIVAGLVFLGVGFLGGLALDWVVITYHQWRDECPIWMDFSGLCRRR